MGRSPESNAATNRTDYSKVLTKIYKPETTPTEQQKFTMTKTTTLFPTASEQTKEPTHTPKTNKEASTESDEETRDSPHSQTELNVASYNNN
ncbi:unnamed protein product, partial [Didymodactylos carnosus]